MKKIIIFLLFIFVLCGCSAEEPKENKAVEPSIITTEPTIEQQTTDTPIPTETNTPTPTVDKDVEIVSRWLDTNNKKTIEEYVAELNLNESDINYKVYDEEHYSFVIKESERIELITKFLSDEAKQEFFAQIYENYPDVYTRIDINDEFSEFKIYANKENYENSDLFVAFAPMFISGLYGELVQSYKLVPIEERFVDFYIIDDKTNEVIYTPTE